MNMKTLVIHPKDVTTDFLSEIYVDKDWTVINTDVPVETIEEQIIKHDRIVMLGHGDLDGLYGYGKRVINFTLVPLLIEKQCVCIWCNADLFVERYGLKGFYTGMIISELVEADFCNVYADESEISQSNADFAMAIKKSIDEKDMLSKATMLYRGSTPVVEYNRKNLYYNYTETYNKNKQ